VPCTRAMRSSSDRAARAAVADLLEVTRRVTLPVSGGGTLWCAEVTPGEMVDWCLSELVEVETELKNASVTLAKQHDFFPETFASKKTHAFAKVNDELGDLLFDVLMLLCVCEREFGPGALDDDGNKQGCFKKERKEIGGCTVAGAATSAARKVRRRCPHTFGSLGQAASVKEEQEQWRRVKNLEKQAEAAGETLPEAPATYVTCDEFSSDVRLFHFLAPLTFGLAVGLTAGAFLWRRV
jgi:NTP pyrophosphatase (non-canonical NTP hydrolase)